MKKRKKKPRVEYRLWEYTYRGCPLTASRSPWCFRLCDPDEEGDGRCGRVAPHGIKSRTQLAIEAHRNKANDA